VTTAKTSGDPDRHDNRHDALTDRDFAKEQIVDTANTDLTRAGDVASSVPSRPPLLRPVSASPRTRGVLTFKRAAELLPLVTPCKKLQSDIEYQSPEKRKKIIHNLTDFEVIDVDSDMSDELASTRALFDNCAPRKCHAAYGSQSTSPDVRAHAVIQVPAHHVSTFTADDILRCVEIIEVD
jgi:hypothetical protein